MKLAVVTDSSAIMSDELKENEHLYVLDIPVLIENVSYIEGKNLTEEAFYQKMAAASELPKTSQPSIVELTDLLDQLVKDGYTHVVGLFLSKKISGFYQNIQYLIEDYSNLTIAFPDTLITSAPLGVMVRNTLAWAKQDLPFHHILQLLQQEIALTNAYILVDDLNHLVKGGRLSNGAAMVGNLLNIKPILYFNDGAIEVYEKIRTEKKAIKRIINVIKEATNDQKYEIALIHANAPEKAAKVEQLVRESGIDAPISIVPFGSVVATHLGEKAIAFGLSPILEIEVGK